MDAILIPVKHLGEAKQRLSPDLSPLDRLRLGLAMLSDVLVQAEQWDRCYVVTRDAKVRELCLGFRCEIITEERPGLNEALALGTEHALAAGVRRLLVLPADVPGVTQSDLQILFSSRENVVIAPSADGGTSALLRTPPNTIQTVFGPGSAAAHLQEARRKGLSATELTLDSLLLDVDDMDDLLRLSAAPDGRLSVQLARDLISAGSGAVRGSETT